MQRSKYVLFLFLFVALLPAVAVAQTHDCTMVPGANGAFTLTCNPAPTATPLPENTATVTPQPTQTQNPTFTPTATPTAPTTTGNEATVNVPLLSVPAGDAALNANAWAMTWLGNVSGGNNYISLRLVGNTDGLRMRLQAIDQSLTPGDVVTVTLNGVPFSAWAPVPRGNDNDDLRGWAASSGVLPWATFGSAPVAGDTWPLVIERVDADSGKATSVQVQDSTVRWGLPDYAGRQTANFVDVPLTGDAMLGGSTDCGAPDYPDYFPTWGLRNWGDSPYATVENQWDIADWPCYNALIAKWELPTLPEGATFAGAELTAWMFGQMGYGPGYADDGTQDTIWQAYAVPATWDETTVNWDNAPSFTENVSWTTVYPVPDAPAWDGQPIPYSFDVAEIVRRAYARGDSLASVLFNTSAGQYHSGKYFYSREGALKPVVRIYYELPATATPSPTATMPPTQTPSPTATLTPVPSPTSTPTSAPTNTPTQLPTQAPTATPSPTSATTTGKVYFISPTGLDTNPGSLTAPFATFNKAWKVLYPGDTLYLMDGTYRQPIWPNVRDGAAGKPITVQAYNDGKATIDATGLDYALKTGESWPGPCCNYFTFRGLVLRGGIDTVLIYAHHTVLDRVSAYDADTNENSSIITVWANDVLLQDVIAAGTGRKNILIFKSNNVTVRRAFAYWSRWDGATFCQAGWPAGNGINPYSSNNVTVENSIAVGPFGARGINLTNQNEADTNSGNRIFGSVAIGTYKQPDGSMYVYPLPANPCGYKNPPTFYAGNRAGMGQITQGPQIAPVWRDVLITGFAQEGYVNMRPFGVGATNVTLDHATIYGNDLAGDGSREVVDDVGTLTITNSKIEGTAHQGAGARLGYRYTDGALTDVPLWPWPMDGRAQSELGYTVTDFMRPYLAAVGVTP